MIPEYNVFILMDNSILSFVPHFYSVLDYP